MAAHSLSLRATVTSAGSQASEIEWTFWENWSARLECDFVGLNSATLSFPTALGGLPGGDQFSGNNRSIQMVNVGINFEFGSWW